MSGIEITALFICPTQGGPMEQMDVVEAIAGLGFHGDRYAKGIGFWQEHGKHKDRIRQGSLFFTQSLEGTGIPAIATRRNMELSGYVPPSMLIGRRIRFGDVLMRGTGDCAPCKRPSQLFGTPGYEKIGTEGGGLRFEILESGLLKPGLPMVLVPEE